MHSKTLSVVEVPRTPKVKRPKLFHGANDSVLSSDEIFRPKLYKKISTLPGEPGNFNDRPHNR